MSNAIAMLSKVNSWESISCKNLEKLTGLLGHCSMVVKDGRTFCRRLYNLHKTCVKSHLKVVRLSSEARDDIMWWLSFLRVFNGKSTVKKETFQEGMVSDSSMPGYVVHFGNDWSYRTWDDVPLFNSKCEHKVDVYPTPNEHDRRNINGKLPYLIENYSICCKDELLCYFRDSDGATHREEETSNEELGSTVYVEE